jgi:mRNA guanylyltransferase
MPRLFVKRDEPLYKYAIGFMEHHWKIKKGIFPGSQPVSIERRHFSVLKQQSYVVCEKTDGVRYMILAFMFENKKTTVCVNRALEMFVCTLNFKRAVYEGTILEGELYEDTTFMIYDALMTCGTLLQGHDFIDRLKNIEELKKLLTVLKYDSIKLVIKTFHLLEEFTSFMDEYLPTVSQKTDGLVFTPINSDVKTGTHYTMFKWKPKEKNTIDFQVKGKGGSWNLYVQEKGTLVYESTIPADKISENVEIHENAIMECQLMIEDEPPWWKPILQRTDKKFPNSRNTFYRTLVNIKEDIQIEDFRALYIST